MGLRVRFRYDVRTGRVEMFQVDDLHEGPPAADHDARHEAVARDVGRVVDPFARIHEIEPEPPETDREDPNPLPRVAETPDVKESTPEQRHRDSGRGVR